MLSKLLLAVAIATTVACGGAPAPATARVPPTPCPAPPAETDDSDAAPTPTRADLEVLRRADALLSDASAWEHSGDRKCKPDARSWNLYCALEHASIEVKGQPEHRGAALQEVRAVIGERTRGYEFAHWLMGYNNVPTTTFADIKSALADATKRIEAKLAH